MANDPFENRFGALFGLGGALPVEPYTPSPPPPSPPLSPAMRAIVDALMSQPKAHAVPVSPRNALADLLKGPPASPKFGGGLLADLVAPPPSFGGGLLDSLIAPPVRPAPPPPPVQPAIKRKAFFSFHYDDAMRVNVVRNAWKIAHRDSATMRSFFDSSLWEKRKIKDETTIKNLIRYGVSSTSAVCVLVGSETWSRRWVRYEIARSIIDKRGLLAVHLNSIKHHHTLTPHTRGPNPLDYMAIGRPVPQPGMPARYYLYELLPFGDGFGGVKWEWRRYGDYTLHVPRPRWIAELEVGTLVALSDGADEYDYMASNGSREIGAWLDRAARRSGR
ncbi:hypothetical protein E0H22_02665 [Rhodopseudomonas boonkerdii]|uniref:TIR domain-containing protein n=1 Tax=Rhodopseudomonas boonkerdii TaxID=475937 RepID=UPI001E48D4D5|nr:TIR domain-containing protein [Rhodopseudomonas boonkerdii]UGV24682.1 hypothetical protein E0H22_02665 [Rhodopseudomonas boonkerdii]